MAVDLKPWPHPRARTCPRGRARAIPAALLTLMAVSLSPVSAASQAAAPQRPNFTGFWNLYHGGQKIEVGRWVQKDKYGKEFGGQEIKGPYIIRQDARGIVWILHDNIVWMFGIPSGDVFDTRRTAEGYALGPDWGNSDLMQLRVRPGATELEIWKDRHGDDGVVEFVFTGFTLVRVGEAKSAPALPRGGVF
jgi:hypothetical protein